MTCGSQFLPPGNQAAYLCTRKKTHDGSKKAPHAAHDPHGAVLRVWTNEGPAMPREGEDLA